LNNCIIKGTKGVSMFGESLCIDPQCIFEKITTRLKMGASYKYLPPIGQLFPFSQPCLIFTLTFFNIILYIMWKLHNIGYM